MTTPTRDEAVREHTDRYHKRPFAGFAPRDEKRRKQVVSLPMDVLLAIVRERLAYLQHGSDLDAVAQFVACEIERAMGVFPNLDGAAPASGGVDAVAVKPLEWKEPEPNWWEAYSQTLRLGYEVSLRRDGTIRTRSNGDEKFQIFNGSIDEAKAAAQADYEQRILSVLKTKETP